MTITDALNRVSTVTTLPHTPIREVLELLDRAGTGAILLCSTEGALYGLVTDGDIRRAILHGISLDEPCISIATAEPVVAVSDIAPSEALYLMDHSKDFVINHLPLVDEQGRAVGLLLRSDLVVEDRPALSAVIMAGGFGTRLRPLTEQVPKPMLPVGDRPLMERIIGQLRESGIHRVHVTTHYLSESITSYFGDGQAFGVEIDYVPESRPLGTAGALKLMKTLDEPLLVINGDILTRVDFRDMLAYHRLHRPDVTVGVRRYDFQIPYGVVDFDGPMVRAIREKPVLNLLVNAGIYLLEPSASCYIPEDRRFDMTDLVQRLLEEGRPVAGFPIVEYWLDIGQHADYERAQEDVKNGRLR